GWVTGQSQVVPLVITPPGASGYKTKGFGRFSTVTQAALIFYRTDKLMYVPEPNPGGTAPQVMPDGSTRIAEANIRVLDGADPADRAAYPSLPTPTMRVVVLLQTFNPTPGAPPWSANVRYQITGLDSLSVRSGA